MQLQTHSPLNKEGQCLNLSAKRETFPVKIFMIYISLTLQNTRVIKMFPFTHDFEKMFKLKNYFYNNELLHCSLLQY